MCYAYKDSSLCLFIGTNSMDGFVENQECTFIAIEIKSKNDFVCSSPIVAGISHQKWQFGIMTMYRPY